MNKTGNVGPQPGGCSVWLLAKGLRVQIPPAKLRISTPSGCSVAAAHVVWDHEVAGSNPASRTIYNVSARSTVSR